MGSPAVNIIVYYTGNSQQCSNSSTFIQSQCHREMVTNRTNKSS